MKGNFFRTVFHYIERWAFRHEIVSSCLCVVLLGLSSGCVVTVLDRIFC